MAAKKTSRKKLTFQWIILGAVFLLSLLIILLATKTFQEEVDTTVNAVSSGDNNNTLTEEHAWVELDFGEGKKRIFTGTVDGESYPFTDVLAAVADEGKFAYRARNGKIETLAGIGGSQGEWKVYRNGTETETSVDKLTVAAGDRYTLKLEK